MKRFAFISRHAPTQGQIDLAARVDIELVPVGDRDAFSVSPAEFEDLYEGFVVVHPAASLRLLPHGPVAVFENANRAAVGEPPRFEAVSLHIFSLLPDGGTEQEKVTPQEASAS